MKRLFLLLFSFVSISVFGQHCPWDCSGMIIMQTNVSAAELNKINPILVDANKNIVVDTMYGTGLETFDTCRFMFYDDFKAHRTEKTKIHYWYRFDTLYTFAEGYAVVRFNFCRYERSGAMLYVRFNNLKDSGDKYSYIEVSPEKRIHLHDYSRMINEHKHDAIKDSVQSFVLKISRSQWGFSD